MGLRPPSKFDVTAHHAWRRRATCVLVSLLAIVLPQRAHAVTHLKRGMAAPHITLETLDGASVSLEGVEGPVVLVFGELYHAATLEACRSIQAAVESASEQGVAATPMLVIAQRAPHESLRALAEENGIDWPILSDTDRTAFGAYRVTVMPSVVVIDRDHRVVHSLAGAHARTTQVVESAILLAAGAIEPEAFELVRHPDAPAASDEQRVRAERLTNLAQQLAWRRMPGLAVDKYKEAIEVDPSYTPARVGLGMLHVNEGRLADAELEFRAVLEVTPDLPDAAVGLAYVQSLRGGDELEEAEKRLRAVLATTPDQPLGLYVLGLIQEQREEYAEAAASFRASAEALMQRQHAGITRKEPGDDK